MIDQMIAMITTGTLHLVDKMIREQGLEKTLEDIRKVTKYKNPAVENSNSHVSAWKEIISNAIKLQEHKE